MIRKGWAAMSSNRRVLQRLSSVRISWKILICPAVGYLYRKRDITLPLKPISLNQNGTFIISFSFVIWILNRWRMSIHYFQRTNTGQSHRGALNQACRGTPPREMQCAVLYGAQLCVHKLGAFARRELHLWVKQCFGRKSTLIRPSE